MNKVEWYGNGNSLELETGEAFTANDSLFTTLILRLGRLAALVDYTKVLVTPDPIGEQPAYDYKITLRDGRVWRHHIIHDVPKDPKLTFKVNDHWRRSEYNAHFPLREVIGDIIEKFGGIVKLEATRA